MSANQSMTNPRQIRFKHRASLLRFLLPLGCVAFLVGAESRSIAQGSKVLNAWSMQDVLKVPESGEKVSKLQFDSQRWYPATVPGTVLTTLVDNKVYPEPLYGENMRSIPEQLNKTSYWYRTTFAVPIYKPGHRFWLHFGGVNYSADVWVNGQFAGNIRGAFLRGNFDVTQFVVSGKKAVVAVLVHPQPHPGVPHEHTLAHGVGSNGGVTAADGPTFLSTIGWDWLAAVRDRDTGIWLPVSLSVTGPVTVEDAFVVSDLADSHATADLQIKLSLNNLSSSEIRGQLVGVITGQGDPVNFSRDVTVPATGKLDVSIDKEQFPSLHLLHPKLWWPNGYGAQDLSLFSVKFVVKNQISDEQAIQFGVRKIEYSVPDSENLTLSVNGVKIMARGGNWGLDEALKRNPRKRLDAEFHMHALANLNVIRNWVGQSTSPDFYDLADKYGILLWDEFFQPNPLDGPDPADVNTYLANVRDKVKRYRNHPSIAVWCARNEGYPPKALDDMLKGLMTQLDPSRLYQSNSADGRGVSSHGPYYWRSPRYFYALNESFKTETGSISIPTLESVQGMMPRKDWETINDDWAQHDMASGAQRGDEYPSNLAKRYGPIRNLADFVRKGQMANYEVFRAMFEGRNAQMFTQTTGVLTWMSNPAQPSFVWQLYHHDLEPNSSLYAVKKASETVHIQLNESNGAIEIVNNTPKPLKNLIVRATVYDSRSKVSDVTEYKASVAGSSTIKAAQIGIDGRNTPIYFVKLDLLDEAGSPLSSNFYWQNVAQDDFTGLETLPIAAVDVSATSKKDGDSTVISVKLKNNTATIALLSHIQLRRGPADDRVLPVFYSDNYVSLVPGEEREIDVRCATEDLQGQNPVLFVDGFNVIPSSIASEIRVSPNLNAQPLHSPPSHLVP